jgi:hypothetical protein
MMTEPETGASSVAEPNIVTWPTDNERKAAFEAYAAAVGKVAHAWNYLHEQLGKLFLVISGAEREVALAIWYSVKSDRAQRDMLRAAVNATNSKRSREVTKAPDDLKWLLIAQMHSPKTGTMLSTRRVLSILGEAFQRWEQPFSMEIPALRNLRAKSCSSNSLGVKGAQRI